MKNRVCLFAMIIFFTIGQVVAFAGVDENLQKADELFEEGGLNNFQQSIDIYKSIISEEPENFEAHWKLARALREYGEEHRRLGTEGYEDVCSRYVKEGMSYAERAIELEPDRAEGYLYYGMNVGTYSEGVGTLTALREGLKNKTQANLEKAYELDPHFANGTPIFVLGRFWQVVPWPYTDRDKAESLYREFQATAYYEQNVESRIFMAELLNRKRGDEHKDVARQMLEEVLELDAHEYWHLQATRMLEDM